ncbi:TOMM system kinase/cyclase fusion protein [Massilia sp. W12]|uniref:TOMM system kinase/cyclase fusion protein n=1 Tax=Massilia sp. W12 TaxID=3126507 RepID=UPI0030D2EF88
MNIQPEGYELLQLLGEGGAGSVYQARQLSTGQIVALKLLRQQEGDDEKRSQRQMERFVRETELCAQLHHTHIVRLLDRGRCNNGQLFACFEYVPGETLREYLTRKGTLDALEAGELMGQVLDALACAHAQGIAHRDLKPQNVMVMHTGTRANVKVLDFGIATFIPERQQQDYRQLTMTQETMGTPSYSAPEQLRGEPPTVKSDLYAWGLLMLECLTGRPVMQGLTLAEIFHKQLSPQPVALPPALVGHALGDLLRRVLQKSPHERPAHASSVYADFRNIHLANLVGALGETLDTHGYASGDTTRINPQLARTMEFLPGMSLSFASERAQLTVLCCRVQVHAHQPDADPDVLETLQREQMSLVNDIAQRYGGFQAGSLGDVQMFYFGYPHASDTDARRAVRTALEMASQVRRRSSLLQQSQGIGLEFGIGMHTGFVLVRAGVTPSGNTPNLALQIQRQASAGQVLVSASTRRLLDQFAEFDDGRMLHARGAESTLACYPLLGEHGSEAFNFSRSGQVRSFVGRQQELAQLQEVWQAAQLGVACALVSGQAGIGKSRLVYEISVAARAAGSVVADCRAFPEHQNNALHPFLHMLKQQLQLHLEQDDERAVALLSHALELAGCALEDSLAVLCSWFALPLPAAYPPSQLSPDRQKKILLDVMQELILHLGRGKPLLLVVEDLHWIDLTSLELISQLRKASGHMMLLMTSRENYPAQIEQSELALSHLRLQQLSAEDSAQMIGAALPGKRLSANALQRLSQRADGIPLFVEELARMLEEKELLLATPDGSYELSPAFDSAQIPITLRDFLAARLARLGSAKETAQLGAAIGREFDHDLLLQIAPVDDATLQTELEQLIAADLIYRQRRVQGDSYIFRHALIRDAAYDSMPRIQREETHERIAQALAAGGKAEVERRLAQLAQHYGLARRFSPAVKYGIDAANRALSQAVYQDACELAEQVNGWAEHLQGSERMEALLDANRIRTNALMQQFGWSDPRVKASAEQAQQLLEAARHMTDLDLKYPIANLCSLAVYHHVANDRALTREMCQRLLQMAELTGDPDLHLIYHTLHGNANWIDGELEAARAHFEYVAAHYDLQKHGHHGMLYGLDMGVWSAAAQANIVYLQDAPLEQVFRLADAAVELAQQTGHPASIGLACMYKMNMLQDLEARDEMRQVAETGLALGQKYGLPAVQAYCAIRHAWCNQDLDGIDQMTGMLRHLGCMLGVAQYSSTAATLLAQQGELQQALARIDESLALSVQYGEHYFLPFLYLLRAGFQQTPHAAQEDLQQACQHAERIGSWRALRIARERLQQSAA